MKRLMTGVALASLMAMPLSGYAQVASLSSSGGACYNFTRNLRIGADSSNLDVKSQILNVQTALASEGLAVPKGEVGIFGAGTKAAVASFQEKYRDDVLVPVGLSSGTGNVGVVTRLKLQALYGCRGLAASAANLPSKIDLAISSVQLDQNGTTITFCNNGQSDLPTAPFRIRLNGINRDFEIIGAQKAGQCDTETFGYNTWGLTYNQGNTYTAVGIIDPNNYYKTGSITAPLNANNTLSVPALPGYHLSVRSVLPKTTGIQTTVCNLGTQDLPSFPLKVVVNGTSVLLDAGAGAYRAGQCATLNWPYSTFGLTYLPNTSYNVSVTTDPNNIFQEVNELDNTATVVGTP